MDGKRVRWREGEIEGGSDGGRYGKKEGEREGLNLISVSIHF